MTLWVLSAMGAIGYMAYLMEHTTPELKKRTTAIISPQPDSKDLALTKIREQLDKTSKSIKEMSVKYYGLDNQIAELNSNVKALKANNNRLHSRVHTIESSINPTVTGSIKQIPPEKTTAKSTVAKSTISKTKLEIQKVLQKDQKLISKKSVESENVGPPTRITPELKNSEPEKQEAEKSEQQLALNIMPMPIRKQKPEITRTQFAIALGNYPDLDRLKKAWQLLVKKYDSTLSPLQPRYITMVVDNQAQYKLVSGPLNNALDAAKICFHLQQSKTYCKQTVYLGSDI